MPRLLALLLLVLPLRAMAEPPVVAADIAPVHSLVARVMQGVGEPRLVLPPGASPHGYAMRPSEAATLEEAALVFWVGPELTPWLERAIGSLGTGRAVALLHAEGTVHRALGGGADHGHDDGHDHGGEDPHAWLDPQNARAWLAVIAVELAAADPGNAETYRRNAEAGTAEIDALEARVEAMLAPHRGAVFIVYHDGYGHFEDRFGLPAAGAVTGGDAARAGAARIAQLRTLLEANPGACVFTEPQASPQSIEALVDGLDVRVGTLDPLGTSQEPGPALYPGLIEQMAATMSECLAP